MAVAEVECLGLRAKAEGQMKIMSVRVRWVAVYFLVVLLFSAAGSVVSFSAESASTTVTYDYHVVAGYGIEPTPPSPVPSPSGFNFTIDPPVYNFGNITYWGGRTYLYHGFAGSPGLPNGAYAKLSITNLLDYDVNITDLTAEVTGGTPTLNFWFSPARLWFGNWTVVWFDPLDPYYPVAPIDECNYYTGEVKVLRDDDWLTKAVREPCDAPTGPFSLLENDPNGDAEATNHTAPITLEIGSTLNEYFGVILFGQVGTDAQANGTITLSLTYERAHTPVDSVVEFPWLWIGVGVVAIVVVVAVAVALKK